MCYPCCHGFLYIFFYMVMIIHFVFFIWQQNKPWRVLLLEYWKILSKKVKPMSKKRIISEEKVCEGGEGDYWHCLFNTCEKHWNRSINLPSNKNVLSPLWKYYGTWKYYKDDWGMRRCQFCLKNGTFYNLYWGLNPSLVLSFSWQVWFVCHTGYTGYIKYRKSLLLKQIKKCPQRFFFLSELLFKINL